MKVIRTLDMPHSDDVDEGWQMYCRIFDSVNTEAAQRHLMYWDEFLAVMQDDSVIKYFLQNDDGSLTGLSVLTNRLKSWPLISAPYFEKYFPDYYARDAIWYCGFVGVERSGTSKPVHGFRTLVCAMLEDIHSNNGMTVMDFCHYNVARKRLPYVTASLLESLHPDTRMAQIDAQQFWAYRFDGKEFD